MEYFRIHLGSIDQIPLGSGRRFMIGIHEILVFRTYDERLFAFENFCQHHGNTLVEGPIEECKLECPSYGHTFNFITGHWSSEGDARCSNNFKTWDENGKIIILYHFPALQEAGHAHARTEAVYSKGTFQEGLYGQS
jgi:nitrite reductase (NADH) small subunit